MSVTINENLNADLSRIMREELNSAGFDTSSISDKDIPIKYFTVSLRTIKKKPRTVVKATGFTCPTDLQEGLALLEDKIINGESLFRHQSKSVNKLSTEDKLLYCWSIHHFHLGTTTDASGFITRTGPVLFAFVTDDTVYMIDVKLHGAWSDTSLLQTIHDNWPGLIEAWKVEGKPTIHLESPDIASLRKSNINAIVKLNDGTSYTGPGLGMSTAGTPMVATFKSIEMTRTINKFIRDIKNNPTLLLKAKYSDEEIAAMNNVEFNFTLKFIEPDRIVAIDSIHGLQCDLFKQQSFLKECR